MSRTTGTLSLDVGALSDPSPVRPARERTGRVERILARMFVACGAFIALLVVVDRLSPWLLGDVRGPIEAAYPLGFLRQPRPYTMFGGTPGGPLNDLGFRGPSPSTPKQPGEFRVMLLGGSTVFEGDPTLAELIEKELAESGAEQVRVYNCGVVSSVSGQELARILFELADLGPDLMVMYNGGNDVLEPIHYDPRPGYPFNYLFYERNPLLEQNPSSYPTAALVAYGSNLCRRLGTWRFTEYFGKLSELRRAVHWGTAPWEERIAEVYVANLIKANRVSAAFGAKFIAFFQPTLAFKDHPAGPEIDRIKVASSDVEISLAVRELIRQKTANAQTHEGRFFFDISDIYDDCGDVIYRDFIHTVQNAKPPAAKIMAQHIALFLLTRNTRNPISSQLSDF